MVIICALGISRMSASDYPWLTFRLADGTEMSVAADNLTMTYQDGKLLLSSGSVNEVFTVSDLESMRFSAELGAIAQVEGDDNSPIELFTVNGIKAGEFRTVNDARRELPSGIYLVKMKNRTIKIIL